MIYAHVCVCARRTGQIDRSIDLAELRHFAGNLRRRNWRHSQRRNVRDSDMDYDKIAANISAQS